MGLIWANLVFGLPCDRSNPQQKLGRGVCKVENGPAGELRGQSGFGDHPRLDVQLYCGTMVGLILTCCFPVCF